ncbi:sugar transferase [Streptococcus parauberis]|uniref:Initial sugar transferase n=1 Tax=Streptococcus parauberis TaxID=1348 RepID=A0A0S3TG47_9STRE|nr:sugar transferase [Streptococcus parauberis]EMF49996.1 Undecaprenyl-phosphate galactosephosphotransferase [Streptococcus parauberis KRS-02109]UWM86177.1 sugar transferase [Streptococcus parauberis]UWM88148.1 sugar transferase [Streptococcus parauberis]BAU04052.1 initial sugar transferase [Streptococcus parauberis]BAU04089.1 initial sugar transferase [Streptococcus parauberis]
MNKEFFNSQVVKHAESIIENKKTDLILKQIFDKVVAVILLLILSPVFLVLAILIKNEDNGPIFYRQERITRYGKFFHIYKFRTMVYNADKLGSLVTTKNDQRITKVGSFIRKYRLDEIPQLLNILEGDMSFVGARPEVMKYVAQYSDEMKITLLLPAGVTSMSSIDFKDEEELLSKYTANGMSLDEAYIEKILPIKMKKNIEYIYKFNFIEDIKIMILTVIHVIK